VRWVGERLGPSSRASAPVEILNATESKGSRSGGRHDPARASRGREQAVLGRRLRPRIGARRSVAPPSASVRPRSVAVGDGARRRTSTPAASVGRTERTDAQVRSEVSSRIDRHAIHPLRGGHGIPMTRGSTLSDLIDDDAIVGGETQGQPTQPDPVRMVPGVRSRKGGGGMPPAGGAAGPRRGRRLSVRRSAALPSSSARRAAWPSDRSRRVAAPVRTGAHPA
jgi:hypothetical protein